jgi:DNA-binding winged helix-turn-helix (wHTH) protein
VLQREDIYQRVWGYAMAHGDRSVDVFVRKVRQKLERASAEWTYIHTHFGIGYRLQPEPRTGGPDPAVQAGAAGVSDTEGSAAESGVAEVSRADSPTAFSSG